MTNYYKLHEAEDEYRTVVFHSALEADGKHLPMAVALDDTMYVTLDVWVGNGVITDSNRNSALKVMNDMNVAQPLFRYYTRDDGGLYMSACMMAKDDTFDPEIVHVMIDLASKHIAAEYAKIMQQIWGKAEIGGSF